MRDADRQEDQALHTARDAVAAVRSVERQLVKQTTEIEGLARDMDDLIKAVRALSGWLCAIAVLIFIALAKMT